MALSVKDLAASAGKWATRASGASSEFQTAAVAAADKWARNAQSAQSNFRQGIAAGNIDVRFARGIARAAQLNKFARKLQAYGSGRYSQGVSEAEGDWSSGFGPYHQVLTGLALPARKPRGDAGNYERVRAVGSALNAKRIAMLGAGG